MSHVDALSESKIDPKRVALIAIKLASKCLGGSPFNVTTRFDKSVTTDEVFAAFALLENLKKENDERIAADSKKPTAEKQADLDYLKKLPRYLIANDKRISSDQAGNVTVTTMGHPADDRLLASLCEMISYSALAAAKNPEIGVRTS